VSELESRIYTHEELNGLDDSDLLAILKDNWGIPVNKRIMVWGKISRKEFTRHDTNKKVYHFNFFNVKSIYTNQEIEYPLAMARKPIRDGVYIPGSEGKRIFNSSSQETIYQCELILSDALEREKYGNPFMVAVMKESIEELSEIPQLNEDDVITDTNNSYISKSIVDFYLQKNEDRLKKESDVLKENIKKEHDEFTEDIKVKEQRLAEENTKLDKKIEGSQRKLVSTEKNILKQVKKRDDLIQDVKVLIKKEGELHDEVQSLKKYQEKYENDMSKKLEKLKSFVNDKAILLKELEFIDEEEFNILLGKGKEADSDEVFLSFGEDFKRDYSKSVSYIQAFLAAQDIIYPRYILEDFLALIQTNDLIILAGDSGSGKTNLVHSFAKAIGGESRIIPVKPNWTSSEDLLGYYNPIEKKYLSTPFLDALIEAGNNPEVPYFICLDEMNLARVEYYFADFLSKLEERSEIPEIELYSDDEFSHILSEFKNVLQLITNAKEKYGKEHIVDFSKLLQDDEINAELKRVFGFSDKDSLIKYHSDLRRMIGGVIKAPTTIKFPPNVRIIGAINIDDTTHYLSPKILDRAHVMKFDSPLHHDWFQIAEDVKGYGFDDVSKKIKFQIEDLGSRRSYPSFKPDNEFCKLMVEYTKNYFSPLGVEVGLRTIRQGLNYKEAFSNLTKDPGLAINNFMIHKILPKLTFDGNKKVDGNEKYKILSSFAERLKDDIDLKVDESECVLVRDEIQGIISKAEENDWIVNYWS